ncbi:hypothetical protein E8E15_002319 [Penicillium rubens]|uniref:Uncharacterized protein n=2 Tax=Penicillium chrysogenum species complex TaxID=254878 RepID=B6H995_PENRW|nr:uncharacterized protein N7525_011159 [Penicillium rubens]KZN83797.1 hypothetical protein EN45_109050 [Penicillium chrysogenum]CAP93154.1 hypothetical protein PCH_Pc16g04840 [Penicillium rubens Wisconsin 54-1255]KAF3011800.1 hypothetical protein E8E15_002319 [Penicillium rubens]KAJ5821875.1 hypothetical protein N7525_011159 [Penicillium rubens]KAJ5859516.1 hypothetical protein N7534_004793 [Penicillium rubens]
MSHVTSRASWLSLLLVSLLVVSTVNALPIYQTDQQIEGQVGKLESRSPRLIPDTAEYVHDILQGLGLTKPSPSSTATSSATPTSTPTSTPTASIKDEQDVEYMKPTHTTHIIYSSSTSYTPTHGSNGAGYTHTVKQEHSNNRPVENIQIGQGWNGGKKITAENFPAVFDAVYKELEHRLSDAINSSDEIGLENFL